MIHGRASCGEWDRALGHEWLATNGLGGYACGTVAGANTRRYHAFLMASLAPPVARNLLVAKIDVWALYAGERVALTANEYADGTVDPRGFVHIESFEVVHGIPTWRYAVGDALLAMEIFMAPGMNVSYLMLTLERASEPLRIELMPLVTFRELHDQGRGVRPMNPDLRLTAEGAEYRAIDAWYWNFLHREESARGLDALEDLYVPGMFSAELAAGRPFTLCASLAQDTPPTVSAARSALLARSGEQRAALPPGAPPWIEMLATAADQFLVRRGAEGAATTSVIAGYPWFADWGRDAMIALPGLATALGRHAMTAEILRTYAGFIDGGMLPNCFPDHGNHPEYNTADATLWFFHALEVHLAAHPDPVLVRDLQPQLMNIIEAHRAGTRFGIGVDPSDGLLRAGEPGVQLTWMDAKQDGRVFTPRTGKPVEINALWLNALKVAARLAGELGKSADQRQCEALLARGTIGFDRFWNKGPGCLFDVIDVDGGNGLDPAVRPNQLIAVSLPHSVLSAARMRAVVDTCARELLTSYGLRSLSPKDAAYRGNYTGGPWQRDSVYHQGTVWSWLLGPFARAHYRVYGDARRAQSFLAPIAQHLHDACEGSVSEIFDGDAPHTARGCFAQAWSVAEILRSWIELETAHS